MKTEFGTGEKIVGLGLLLLVGVFIGFGMGRQYQYLPDEIKECQEAGGVISYWVIGDMITSYTMEGHIPTKKELNELVRIKCYKAAQTLFIDDLTD